MKTGKTLSELAAEIERQYQTKKDYVADLNSVTMTSRPEETGDKMRLSLDGVGTFGVTEIAHEQIAEHTGIPKRYYDRMRVQEPELLANNVDVWFRKHPAPRLIRTLDGNARGFLSDKFRALDNYDFAGATLPILAERKLQVMSCEITEKRLYIKAVDQQLFRDVPVGHKMGDGTHTIFDTCSPVVILSNSEVGFGRFVLETGVYTRGCTNMALWAGGGMKKTHVGARHALADGISVGDLDEIMSQATKKKTMEALWMQVRDVLSAAFNAEMFDKRLKRLEEAAQSKITGKIEKVMEVISDRFEFNDGERDSIFKHLIEGGSLTQYGLHAASTRAAQDVPSYDRATELEYIGPRVLELPRQEWARMAEAA
jgi:hypothetical protein